MHWSLYSAIIGSLMFAYIQLFVQNMQTLKEANYSLTWGQFVDKTLERLG
jgi:hypothetical protein